MLPSPYLPSKNIQHSLIRPIFGLRDQLRFYRIFLNIMPFFGIAFAASQTRIPTITLPFPCLRQMQTAELALPMRHPSLQSKL